jgi:hypothetical protein
MNTDAVLWRVKKCTKHEAVCSLLNMHKLLSSCDMAGQKMYLACTENSYNESREPPSASEEHERTLHNRSENLGPVSSRNRLFCARNLCWALLVLRRSEVQAPRQRCRLRSAILGLGCTIIFHSLAYLEIMVRGQRLSVNLFETVNRTDSYLY